MLPCCKSAWSSRPAPASRWVAGGVDIKLAPIALQLTPQNTTHQTWGFTDKHTFLGTFTTPPGVFYFDAQYDPKPVRNALVALINSKRWPARKTFK